MTTIVLADDHALVREGLRTVLGGEGDWFVVGEAARDPEDFDRDAMHEVINPEIVDFFDRKLRAGEPDRRGGAQPTPSHPTAAIREGRYCDDDQLCGAPLELIALLGFYQTVSRAILRAVFLVD